MLSEADSPFFVLTVTTSIDGARVSIDHPMGPDAWRKARSAMIEAHAELTRQLADQAKCPARPAALLDAARAESQSELLEALKERVSGCVPCHGTGWSDTISQGSMRPYAKGPCPTCAKARSAISRAEGLGVEGGKAP